MINNSSPGSAFAHRGELEATAGASLAGGSIGNALYVADAFGWIEINSLEWSVRVEG
jgi:hypothetical protein